MTYADNLHPKDYFYACDGTVIRNIEELFLALQDMPTTVFDHHVNDDRNDFHIWVKDVFQNYSLAKNMSKATDRDEMLKSVFVSLFR